GEERPPSTPAERLTSRPCCIVTDEAELMAAVSAGDAQAFEVLVRRHLPAIEVYALRFMGDRGGAQDITQEVMLKLWQRAGDYDASKARVTTWLHRLAHNVAIDQLRRSAKYVDDTNLPEGEAPPDVIDESGALETALARLPINQRNALVLTYYQDLSNKEVAEIMDLGVRALESLLVRARATLKKHIEVNP
ncbi:MAG: sigma-70 family RNA polymerase sigma factor, partial [Halieaceae bacterium]